MGMQCHFRKIDLPERAVVQRSQPDGDEGWSIYYYGQVLHAWSPQDDGESFWFDVGSRTEHQMMQLARLIEWRACFQCN
jgi:hypothetical protein